MSEPVDPLPEWVRQTPNLESLHNLPDVPWGGYVPRDVQLPSLPDLAQFVLKLIERFLREVVVALRGFHIPGLPSFDQLKDWAENLPDLGQIIQLIWNSPINPVNIVGSIAHLLTQLNPGAFSTDRPNLLPSPNFEDGSIPMNSVWSVDLSKSRAADGTGAAKIILDGTPKPPLWSGRTPEDQVLVAEGQTITASVFVSHEGYVGSGAAVLLQVRPYVGGVAQPPVTVAEYIPASGDAPWPGVELTGTYVVPEGVTGLQHGIAPTVGAAAGTFWFDAAKLVQSGKIQQSWVDQLPETLQDLLGRWQLLVDTIIGAVTGVASGISHTLEDLAQALTSINPANILGVLGLGNIAEAIQEFLDALVGGLVGQPGSGATLPDLFNTILKIASQSARGDFAWIIHGVSTNKPVDKGKLPSGDANYPYSNANTWIPVTQTATLAITYRAGKSEPLGVIGYLGKGSTGLSGLYINVRKIDPVTGARVLVHHSPNLASLLPVGDAVDWVYYELDNPLPREISDEYEIQIVPVGSGTHYVRGYDDDDDIPDHPYANVKSDAAVRDESANPDNPPLSIAKSAVVRSSRVMWIETAVDTGTGSDHHDPAIVYLGSVETSIPKPKWANAFDLIGVGGSGAGRQASLAQFGEGGSPGKFNAATYVSGEHFDADDDIVIAFTPGAAGKGGTGVGGKGGDTVFTFPGYELVCDGGAGGDSLGLIGKPVGIGAKSLEYNGELYVAGGDQKVPSGNGVAPGGGGNGGDRFFNNGGHGALGGGWVRFYKRDVTTEVPPPLDTTPPTPPTTEVVSKTFSTITVRAVGGTDE
ncbi:minor tail protein [Mycobacterium phage MooMoo]|uniref:Minor tail protein n=1 Tax=Mycobacterium phage MooMoo TaxID=2108127 RepID=A0A2P1JR44_9CAUD|nr:minor tail protein [Mycobacterium phage MooMoo]AVO21624.1 minor tail protein [Mycobacterium phage MooMoo]